MFPLIFKSNILKFNDSSAAYLQFFLMVKNQMQDDVYVYLNS